MNIVADENVDRQIVDGLRASGHEVVYVAELAPGISDLDVLSGSVARGAVLLTSDKDFGELVYRRRLRHAGIVFLRLEGLTPVRKSHVVSTAFRLHGTEFSGRFAVLTERSLRIRE